ncbi:MAG: WD40/YVTN/BNR-like repeat-containing protein, partial [Acidobacteriota bacterium]
PVLNPRSILADPSSPEVAYSDSPNGLYRTRDGGATWQLAGPPGAQLLAADPAQSTRLYLRAASGIYRSDDGVDSWQLLSDAEPASQVSLLAVGPGAPPVLIAAYSPSGPIGFTQEVIVRSDDNGTTWTQLTGVVGTVSAIVVDPEDSQRLWVGYYGDPRGGVGGVSRSFDGGATWQDAPVEPGASAVFSLALDPSDPNTLFAGTSSGVLVTRDAGTTWQPLPSGLPPGGVAGLAVRQGTRNVLFAASSGGVYALELGSAANQR